MLQTLAGLSLIGLYGLTLKIAEQHERRNIDANTNEDVEVDDILLLRNEIEDFPMTEKQFRVFAAAMKEFKSELCQMVWCPNIHHHSQRNQENMNPQGHSNHHLTRKEKISRDIEEYISIKH